MRQFDRYQFWFLIPGVILMAASILVPLNYCYKQFFWEVAEAKIGERVERGEGVNVQVLFRMSFTDAKGYRHEIVADDDNSFTEGSYPESVRIYYDPSNPANFELVNHAQYLLLFFLPFGLLCCYLGWPEKVDDGRGAMHQRYKRVKYFKRS